MEIDGIILQLEDVPNNYARCFCDSCPRAAECLRHAVGQITPNEAGMGNCVFPQSMNVVGGCPFFRPLCTRRVAWGMSTLFWQVLARDSATIHVKLNAYFGSQTNYYRYNRGEKRLSPKQQQDVLAIFSAAGYDPATLQFGHYATEIDF